MPLSALGTPDVPPIETGSCTPTPASVSTHLRSLVYTLEILSIQLRRGTFGVRKHGPVTIQSP